MRSIHVVFPFRMLTVLLSAACLAAVVPASALTIESPTEGRNVRDQVKIVVPRSSLPSDVARSGFLAIKIDGRFTAAVSTSDPNNDSDKIVYMWDSKAQIDDPKLPADQRSYRDGRHAILVEAHAMRGKSKDTIAASATVNVVLQNQVARPNPAPNLKLVYRYHLGQQSIYKISVRGEILDANGYSLSGGQPPILGEFYQMQSVEDVKPDGSALLRYKVQKDGYTQVFGQATLLDASGQSFKSLYKIIDAFGRTIEDNVLSTKSEIEVTDILVRLPGRPVQIGETWDSTFRLRLEGLSDTANLMGQSKLDGLEWERGFKCAKIVSKLNGLLSLNFLAQGVGLPANATSTAYFAYGAGKLIKDVMVFEFNTRLDSGFLSSLQPQQIPSGDSGATAPGSGGPLPPGMGPMPGMMPPGPPSYTSPTVTGDTSQRGAGGNTMPVIVRLVVTRSLGK